MGNTSTKEARPPGSSRGDHPQSPSARGNASHPSGGVYTTTAGGGRRSRHDLFSSLRANPEVDPASPEARRETKPEREARKLEKERALRLKERERSIQEESVDGGYLVTMGVYTGPEDFSKPVVRQLMIERRIAPFWRGLNNHEDSWTEHQLVAAAKGLPIPAADEIPEEESPPPGSVKDTSPRQSDTNIDSLTIPITGRTPSHTSETNLSPSHPAFAVPSPPSSFGSSPPAATHSPFFRGRAKSLAALTSPKNASQPDMVPQEIKLPDEPYVNGHRVEAFLYKDASECPICFLYYPPWLNKTRCCDQPICSECFVQIKRPDPHPPEHHDDDPPTTTEPSDGGNQDYQLISEPATCPFCKMPEFGITYEAPPFRRGLAYAHSSAGAHALASVASAMSSSSSLASQGVASQGSGSQTRRRTTSLSASSPQVITTDRVRPDWAKKLSDARAQALRRAAAATALHNAAYVLGNVGSDGRGGFGRRRRTIFSANGVGENSEGSGSGTGTPRQAEGQSNAQGGTSDIFPPRQTSRRPRIEDIEELMMMEAIRLSLQAEEERLKKEEKEREKEAKKEEKKRKKEEKKARKSSLGGASTSSSRLYNSAHNGSTTSDLATSAASASGTATPNAPVPASGKGKAPVGVESPSTASSSLSRVDTPPSNGPQAHLEQSRATLAAQNHLGDVQIPGPSLLGSPTKEGAVAASGGEEAGAGVGLGSGMGKGDAAEPLIQVVDRTSAGVAEGKGKEAAEGVSL